MRPSRTRSLLVSALVLALFGLGWFYLAPTQIGGSTRYVVTHGISMKPLLHTGDLVLVRPADNYRVGQVVAYRSTLLHTVVLHRIIRIDGSHYVFKGDNNSFIDPTSPTRSLLIGRMWLLIPNGGVVLSWLHTPWVAALLLGAVAAGLLFGGGQKRRRRRDRGRRQTGPTSRTRGAGPVTSPPLHTGSSVSNRQLFTASIVGVVVFAVLGIVALVRSTAARTPINQSYVQQMSFGYRSHVPPGPVYPNGDVVTGDPIYVQLVHRVTMTAAYQLRTAAPHQIHGTMRIRGTLTNTSGWSRSFWLAPATRFAGDRVRASALINLTRLESLTNRISAQIGSGSYTLSVVPRVNVAGHIGGQPVHSTYSPSLSLVLGTSQFLSGTSALNPSSSSSSGTSTNATQSGLHQSTTTTVTSVHSADATLAGVPVTTVRWIALAGLVLCGLLAVLTGSRVRDSDPEPAERINSRYKHLIVPVEPVTPSPDHPPIDVGSIDALAQLAERSERLILHDHQEDVDNYLVDDQGTLFRFRAARVDTAHMNGTANANGTGLTGDSDENLDPAATAAAAILSSAAASLSAAAAEATAGARESDTAAEPRNTAPSNVTEEGVSSPLRADDAPPPKPTDAAVPHEPEHGGASFTRGPVSAPLATDVRTRSVSHLRESSTDPRLPPTSTMAHRSIRPEYRLGLTIGPLALTFLAWHRIRARRRRRRGDDPDDRRTQRSWASRNLARR